MRNALIALVATAITLIVASVAAATTHRTARVSASCTPGSLNLVTPGTLTIGTDNPAYPPWYGGGSPKGSSWKINDPSTGQGFESAVAYAVAKQLGFTKAQVKWLYTPFDKSYAPGKKSFDFDINQISITPERAKAVTFSDGYYTVNQAVIALKTSSIASAKSIADLKSARLGAQVGTTQLSFIDDTINPSTQPRVYNDTAAATAALKAKQIDGLVVDLPTAYYITAAELDGSKIVGQFKAQDGPNAEKFGLLLQKGNTLASCLNTALEALKSSGQLQQIQDKWLAGVDAPYFTE